ncbi:uncharacterized protein LOC143026286 [Oratosquilla oratoria]|uniref:uncharacterized protein LOC143026286 n=1 Tax=Oratosquilla oratoria TaxID=337810 RepID=UPI003F7753DB
MSSPRKLEDDAVLELRQRWRCLWEEEEEEEGLVANINYSSVVVRQHGSSSDTEVGMGGVLGAVRSDGTRPTAWVVGGEAGTGRTALARFLLKSWCTRDRGVQQLTNYTVVFLMEAESLDHGGYWEYFKSALPDTCAMHGAEQVATWLETAHALIIIDDFVTDSEQDEELKAMIEDYANASVMVLTSPEDVAEAVALLSPERKILCAQVRGLSEKGFHLYLEKAFISQGRRKEYDQCKDFVQRNKSIFKYLKPYPRFVRSFVKFWVEKRADMNTIRTKNELLWKMLEFKFEALCVQTNEAAFNTWFSEVCRKAHTSIVDGVALSGEHVDDLFTKAQRLLPNVNTKDLLSAMFYPRLNLLPVKGIKYSIHSRQLQEHLAGFYIMQRISDATPLKRVTNKRYRWDGTVLASASHFLRLSNAGQMPEKKEKRVLTNLLWFMECVDDVMGYVIQLIGEIKCHSRLVGRMLDECELQKNWDVKDDAILAGPLDALLNCCPPPRKVIVAVREGFEPPELGAVVDRLRITKLPISVMAMHHLEFGSDSETDTLVAKLQKQNSTAQLEDFIGCLSLSSIESLGRCANTKSLVCLRARIKDAESLIAMLKSQHQLPHLKWLEIDVDMDIRKVEMCSLPASTTPLMDMRFKNLTDSDVIYLCDFLAKIRKRYSGLHIHDCSLTIQGATDVIKECYRRGISLHGAEEAIASYRRWRFVELSFVPPQTKVTAEDVIQLAGYDDSKHYTDNDVYSSHVANRVDVMALKYFLEFSEEIVYFAYICRNYSVVKSVSGTVEVKELL